MSAANPAFANVDRAPYEFGHLMRALPRHISLDRAMSTDERQQAKAAIDHALNANGALLDGMEAIGHLLFSTATNEDYPADPRVLAKIGGLIKHLAVEMQFLCEQRECLQSNLDTDDKLVVKVVAPAKKVGAA